MHSGEVYLADMAEPAPRIRWWRRRESNPHPKVATDEIYTFSSFTYVSLGPSR